MPLRRQDLNESARRLRSHELFRHQLPPNRFKRSPSQKHCWVNEAGVQKLGYFLETCRNGLSALKCDAILRLVRAYPDNTKLPSILSFKAFGQILKNIFRPSICLFNFDDEVLVVAQCDEIWHVRSQKGRHHLLVGMNEDVVALRLQVGDQAL